MDFTQLKQQYAADEAVPMVVDDPRTGSPLRDEATGKPVTIFLLGPDSSVYRQHSRDQQSRRLKEMSSNRRRGLTITPQELEDSALDLIVRCTTGWEHIEWNGEEFPFSPENARQLYMQMPFVREQVEEFIQDRRNFFTS